MDQTGYYREKISPIFKKWTLTFLLIQLTCALGTNMSEEILPRMRSAIHRYSPDWPSLDSRPLPSWYDEAKIGIFIHWGVFSVPSFGSEWFWHHWKADKRQPYVDFMNRNYKPGFTYQDFAKDFTAEFYDPERWADIFKSSGAQYVVLTSKHHEGFTLWPSKTSFSWNAQDVGPGRDLIGPLAAAIRKTGLKFGLYHSLFEWFNPLYLADRGLNFTTNRYARTKAIPELIELVNRYEPAVLWSDGDAAPDWYWNTTQFLSWLYSDSPVRDLVVTNDRWGNNLNCKHGDFRTCDDRYNPGQVLPYKWENAMTLDRHSWGYRREARLADILSFEELITQLVSTISCGGNILINVGPTHEGVIVPIFEQRLRQLGGWLQVTGEAFFHSRPWTFQNETLQRGIWYTRREGWVYATVLQWPAANLLTLKRPELAQGSQVTLLGYHGHVKWSPVSGGGLVISMPEISRVGNIPQPWVFRFSNLTNL